MTEYFKCRRIRTVQSPIAGQDMARWLIRITNGDEGPVVHEEEATLTHGQLCDYIESTRRQREAQR